ncbi:hypothetical protein FOXG_19701 [Fusarium oxysporum f. sp. lycopersici 4287]|uniref:Uncharacterized protein n=1 Tax=Fusarium oxysporum f. sp. lycopersici (strain 4287 / CBS 123668 / FGSC 9935 / NRRL 34936) TaxID=426428 RepID=A0A0J9UYZ9_FUSO4|nr:hypothetical protein FOXG_19325 [Fusarium oxysporum f. sp. lycopersici 4287]XP_018242628.1 hypothetical protein FOXG_19336 [Fusarium oxysporum f. sp. lycopersici 4287]XP_018244561.1 hypothetical protein FOXG_19701 [Fusarium oxysporum f. sp. lycopersici 4287]KAJ9419390.1 hypothetical protein QL093DRAFT_2063692 [Fusarium oxysporum]KNB04554.1 hypothetical protein FOXG_19325 [Fusarium oxysporum f. sp. lycopersici 4287]KNB04583.1 hypothetical protein FOXG_19336 [Fusarium oxysporum f. sp. lycoper
MDDNLPHDGRSGLISRLGKVSIAVLMSSFVVCLGCLTFLAFLWGANTNNAVWRSIVLAGWTTRSITITSLVLRWATAAQAATCTSMLAAILLQRGAVPLPAAAAVSIIRFDNTGPWSLLGKMGAEWHHRSISIGLLATLLTFTTLSLQFTSTVLLSQVGIASLPVATSVPQTYYGTDTYGPAYGPQGGVHSFFDTTPARYPAFAEWISNATISDTTAQHGEFAPSSAPGIIDTGTVVRAFLPFKDDERSRLIEYHGFGTVVDTRVVCVRPRLTNIVFSTDNDNPGYYAFRITGLADVEQKPLGFLRLPDDDGSKNNSLSFDCGFTTDADPETYGWPLALCELEQILGIYSVMDSKGFQVVPGPSYLLINATLTNYVTNLDGSDVWESITLKANDTSESLSLQFTLCMTAFKAQQLEINATRPASFPPEPTVLWNTSTATYNTKDVLRQFGAGTSRDSTARRGIFDLASRSWQWREQPILLAEGDDFDEVWSGFFSTTAAIWVISPNPWYRGLVNEAQYSIFTHMARSTANPALALQAYFTTLCAICYYERIIMFDTAAPSSRVSLVQVTRPLGWTAFIIVVSVVMLHLLLVLLAILIFRRAGNLSRIQNAWASISQLLGPTTESWIRDADTVDDKTVKSWLKDRGLSKTLVRVEHVQSRVQLVEKDKVS